MTRALVTGAGGFIGHHLAGHLKRLGYWVRGIDLKHPEYAKSPADEFEVGDLRRWATCEQATRGIDHVFALAADMGGMGFISANHATILRNNALINLNTLDGARRNGATRYLFASSACVYPEDLQGLSAAPKLGEDDTRWRAPEGAYGFEKLFGERLCRAYADEHGLDVRVVRFHNVYGPLGTWQGGREKVPAALCRKVAEAEPGGTVEVWGDGQQTRSFMHVTDCVEGITRIMESDCSEPLNLGTDRLVSIDELAELIIRISGKPGLALVHVDGPMGVRGRNSDNTRLRKVLDWEPSITLEDGLAETYGWVEGQVRVRGVRESRR